MRIPVLLLASLAAAASAGTIPLNPSFKNGYQGAFLIYGAGSRAASLAGAFTAVADDASAQYWNPAGLAQADSPSGMLTYNTLGNGMGVGTVAVAGQFGPMVACLGASHASFDGIEGFDEYGSGTGPFSASESAVQVSAASLFPDSSSMWGVSAHHLQPYDGPSVFGLGFGLLVPLGPQLAVGLAGQNIGSDSSPAIYRGGAAYRLTNLIRFSADGWYNKFYSGGAGGIEWSPVPVSSFRAGYEYSDRTRTHGNNAGLALGFGVRFPQVALDYAYQPFGDIATSQRFTLIYGNPFPAKPLADNTPWDGIPIQPPDR